MVFVQRPQGFSGGEAPDRRRLHLLLSSREVIDPSVFDNLGGS
jgi:hypothetical protein